MMFTLVTAIVIASSLRFTIASSESSLMSDLMISFNEESKTCLTKPDDCLLGGNKRDGNCLLAVTWTKSPDDPNSMRFELLSFKQDPKYRKTDYIAFGLSRNNEFMSNASVLVCSILNDFLLGEEVYAYLAHNRNQFSHPLLHEQLKTGVKLVRSEITSSHFLCVIDRKIKPTRQQAGQVFPLDQFWHVAIAVGPIDETGFIKQHHLAYQYDIGCEVNVTSTEQLPSACRQVRWLDRNLVIKLHATFMMIGWMICIGCGLFAPRYLRCHRIWFTLHRIVMIIGFTLVTVAFGLIFAVHDFRIILPREYPDIAHPVLGLLCFTLLLINPVGALCRCKGRHAHYNTFVQIHSLVGGSCFGLATVNMVVGTFMISSGAFYAVVIWVANHFSMELLFYLKMLQNRKGNNNERTQSAKLPDETNNDNTEKDDGISVKQITTSSPTVQPTTPKPSLSLFNLKTAVGVFLWYAVTSTILAIVASTLLFII